MEIYEQMHAIRTRVESSSFFFHSTLSIAASFENGNCQVKTFLFVLR